MVRYNSISRPVHDSNDPPATLPATPLPKIGGRDPQLPGLTPLDSSGKEAFSRRKELPRGGLRRMKMPQEKNGENTDLKCDLVLCRNKDKHYFSKYWGGGGCMGHPPPQFFRGTVPPVSPQAYWSPPMEVSSHWPLSV